MTLKGPEFKKAMLLGLIASFAPLVLYPQTFGWGGAMAGTARLFLVELAYYVAMFHLLWNRPRPARVFAATLTGISFRLGIGLVTALLLSAAGGLHAGEALRTSLFGYLPGALLHIGLVPFVLRGVFHFPPVRRFAPGTAGREAPRSESRPHSSDPALWAAAADGPPDFDAAMAHVGAYSTVELAVLVDHEGLTVARAGRPSADSDLWAPVVHQLLAAVRRELGRTPDDRVQRLELSLSDRRLVAVRVPPFLLAVLFDSATDELVNVRIAQAVDMVKRYADNKYPKVTRSAAREVAYV